MKKSTDYPVWEFTHKSFDGGTDKTDHLVKWVEAETKEIAAELVEENFGEGYSFCQEIYVMDGIDVAQGIPLFHNVNLQSDFNEGFFSGKYFSYVDLKSPLDGSPILWNIQDDGNKDGVQIYVYTNEEDLNSDLKELSNFYPQAINPQIEVESHKHDFYQLKEGENFRILPTVIPNDIPEWIKKMDWALLTAQKNRIVESISRNECSTNTGEALDGIVLLLDAIQDWAADDLGLGQKTVFPSLEEE